MPTTEQSSPKIIEITTPEVSFSFKLFSLHLILMKSLSFIFPFYVCREKEKKKKKKRQEKSKKKKKK